MRVDATRTTVAVLLMVVGAILAAALPLLIVLALVMRTPAAAGWAR